MSKNEEILQGVQDGQDVEEFPKEAVVIPRGFDGQQSSGGMPAASGSGSQTGPGTGLLSRARASGVCGGTTAIVSDDDKVERWLLAKGVAKGSSAWQTMKNSAAVRARALQS